MKRSLSCIVLLAAALCVCSAQSCKPADVTAEPEIPVEPEPEPEPEPSWDWIDGYPVGVSIDSVTWALSGGKICTAVIATCDFAANPYLQFNCVKSNAGKKAPSAFFADFNAKTRGTPVIAVNGGYFAGATSVSMVVSHGSVMISAWREFNWPSDEEYECPLYTPRAALGWMKDEDGKMSFDIEWAYCTNVGNRDHTAYPDITTVGNNEKTKTFRTTPPTDDPEEFPGCFLWEPYEAMGGGPYLVKEGKNIAISSYWHECLDAGGTAAMSCVPRTAAGFTPDGKLVIVACEGRNINGSAGIRLDDLADKFIELGCTEAVNFDGGGSSIMIGSDGQQLMTPSDSSGERKVMAAIIISEKR